MSQNIEIEAKSLISKQDYEKLLLKYKEIYHPYVQVNHLLNPKDIPLSKSMIACRIRNKDDFIEFTIKIQLDEGKLEINQELSPKEFDEFINKGITPKGEVHDELIKRHICNPNNLEVFALLTTTRFDIPGDGYLLSVDKSEYLDVIDYEVECESTSMENALKHLQNFLNKENIPFKRNTKSKLKRVKERLI